MGFYEEWILRPLSDLSMRNKRLRPYRERVAGAAEGRVLDVGIGSRSAKSSDSIRRRLCWREPSARRRTWKFPSTSSKVQPNASRLRTAAWTRSSTWTGCSIPEIRTALVDMRCVLKIGGRLLFVEHGRAPEPSVARWQDRLDPLWLRFSGGCHLNRKIDNLLAEAGFRLDRLETGYIAGARIMTFLYEGAALPR